MRGVGVLFMIGRLNPGVTPEAARDAWTRANAQLQANSVGPKYDIAATPFLDYQIGPARQAMWVLFGAVGVLLLIACANVSGLMLTRVSLRNRDDAIRVAIGGSAWRHRAAVGGRNGVADRARRRARPAHVPVVDRHHHRAGAGGHPAAR